MLSGPSALDGLQALMASSVWVVVKRGASVLFFFLTFLEIFLASLEVLWLTTEEYCLLNLFAILAGQVICLSLKEMAWFLDALGLPLRFLITLNNLTEFPFWILPNASLHFSLLCSLISLLIR